MSEPEAREVGWRVLDPEGNVVDSGTVTVLIAASDAAQTPLEE